MNFSKVVPRSLGPAMAVFLALSCSASSDAGGEPGSGASVASQLQSNAEQFEYETGQMGGSYTVATISGPLTFNLAIATDASSSGVLSYVFEGLTEISWLTGEVEPGLAESWTSSDDGLKWTFKLRDGVRWHDGEPFTARDVEFTFNRIIYNDEIPARERSTFLLRHLDESGQWQEAPIDVTALDDLTVEFSLPVPFAPFLRALSTAVFPKHILEEHVEAGVFADVWGTDTDPAEIIGTGPFKITSYVPEERVVLKRNPDYWLTDSAGNSLPYLDEIVRVVVADRGAALDKFVAGESDAYGVSGEDFQGLADAEPDSDFTLHGQGPGFGTTFLGFNMNPGQSPDTGEPYVAAHKLTWFTNVEFRRAVAHSIDRDRLVEQVQHGLAFPQWSSISPAAGDFHNPGVTRFAYDIDAANGLLDELGWVDSDGDGIREDDDGNKIEFTLVTSAGNESRITAGDIIIEGMEQVGLSIDYEVIPFGDVVSQLDTTYDWETVLIGFSGAADPYDGIALWHSSASLHLWHPNQPAPQTPWEAEIDDLYVRASQELDYQKRIDYYRRAQEVAALNVPLIYTTLPSRTTAVRDVFGNVTPTLYGLWDTRYLYRLDR